MIYIAGAVCTHCDATLARQLLLGLFGWIRIAQMTIEILVKYFGCLLAKIATFAACIKETGTQDHNRFAGRLLQLHLYRAEFLVNYLHHALNFFGCDGSGCMKARV